MSLFGMKLYFGFFKQTKSQNIRCQATESHGSITVQASGLHGGYTYPGDTGKVGGLQLTSWFCRTFKHFYSCVCSIMYILYS